jgi:hypothetical protein
MWFLVYWGKDLERDANSLNFYPVGFKLIWGGNRSNSTNEIYGQVYWLFTLSLDQGAWGAMVNSASARSTWS